MTREDAIGLLDRARQQAGAVPEIDRRAVAEWFVALRDQSGLRMGLKLLDRQMRRTDLLVARLLGTAPQRL